MAPGGDRANYAFQRHITHTYPASDASLETDRELGRHHVEAFQEFGSCVLADARLFEFGAGWDLAMPLILRSLGAQHQLVVDLRPLARPDLVADVARRIGLDPAASLEAHGIEYRAPADARATGEPPGSIDLITSTNTLEHIPRDDIAAILRECHRLLRPDGVMSFQVDYKDHYSYFDRRLSPYAFLRHSPARWRLYNPALHHQNRLRHSDYLTLFDAAGFDVVHADVTAGSVADVAAVMALPPHASFRGHTPQDLAVREARVVLRRRGDA